MAELDLGKIGYEVEVDDKQYHRKLSGMEKSASSTGKNIMKMLSFVAGITIFKKFVEAASDLEEVENKFATVFAAVRKEADATRKHLQDFYGLGKKQSATMLGNTGDLLTGVGFDAKTSLELSKQVQEMAVDLASFSNYAGGASGASEALTKALLGETEMMKSLGVTLNQNSSRFKELMRENKEAKGMTEMQAKAYTVLTMTIEQSKNAMGDYARTADSFANRYRKGVVDAKDAVAEMGKQLIPVAQKILTVFSSLLKITNVFNGGLLRTATYLAMAGLAVKSWKKLHLVFKGIGIAINKSTIATTTNTVAEKANTTAKTKNVALSSIYCGVSTKSTIATNVDTASTTVNTAAKNTNAVATVTLKGALKGLWATMLANPFTAIFMIGGMVLSLIMSIVDGINQADQEARQKLQQNLESARQQRQALETQNADTDKLIARLKEINSKEKLNNIERREQARILSQLKSRHKDFNAEIDAGTGKINDLTKAMEKLGALKEKQRQDAKKKELDSIQAIIKEKGLDETISRGQATIEKNKEIQKQHGLDPNKIYKNKSIFTNVSRLGESGKNIAKAQEMIKKAQAEIDALMKPYLQKEKTQKANKEVENAKKIADTEKSYNKYKSGFTNDHKSDYTRNTEVLKKEYEQQKQNLETLKKAGVYKGLQYYWELAKLKSIHAIKQGELELDKQQTEEARKKAQIEDQAYKADQKRRQEQNELRVNQDLEYKKLEAEAWSDGKLTDDERLKLKEREIEATKEQIEQQKKHAEQLDGMAKKQAQSGILSLETSLGKLNGEIASMVNKNSNQNPDKVVQSQGGFLANVVKTMGSNQEDHAKSTAQNTKEIERVTKQIVVKMDQQDDGIIIRD